MHARACIVRSKKNISPIRLSTFQRTGRRHNKNTAGTHHNAMIETLHVRTPHFDMYGVHSNDRDEMKDVICDTNYIYYHYGKIGCVVSKIAIFVKYHQKFGAP